MSHVVAMKSGFKNLDALEEACRMLGTLELVRGKTTYNWYGVWMRDYHAEDAGYKRGIPASEYGKCAHVIRLKDSPASYYEIGLVQRGDEFIPIFDYVGTGKLLQKAVGGNEMHALQQAYNTAVFVQNRRAEGYEVTCELIEGEYFVEYEERQESQEIALGY